MGLCPELSYPTESFRIADLGRVACHRWFVMAAVHTETASPKSTTPTTLMNFCAETPAHPTKYDE
jgi:hypothetical protein